jgi:hypothetical protein
MIGPKSLEVKQMGATVREIRMLRATWRGLENVSKGLPARRCSTRLIGRVEETTASFAGSRLDSTRLRGPA